MVSLEPITSFSVHGTPRPGGSKRGFVTKNGRVAMVDASGKKGRDWRGDVQAAALEAFDGSPARDVPLALLITFLLPRPKSHYRTGKHSGELKPGAPSYNRSRPDLTKLLRSIEDALTGVIWHDDSLIVIQNCEKRYSESPGAIVEVFEVQYR